MARDSGWPRKNSERHRPAKVVLLGDCAAGKTSLVLRFVYDEFVEGRPATVGASLFKRSLFVKEAMVDVELEIWDTAGQERYRSITPSHYRGADAAIIVYDITNIDSFVCAKRWIEEVEQQTNPTPIIILVGNKKDLPLRSMVPPFQAEAYALFKRVSFLETSAKTARNVREVFYEAAKLLARRTQPPSLNRDSVVVMEDKPKSHPKSSSSCCG
jgi:Ras-related protein Rab-5C